MIKAANLFKRYPGDILALKNVSFHIEKGEVCAYLGANGAGKTTTVNILCGIIQPDEGTIHINNIDLFSRPDDVKRIIGYVPESGALFESLTPADFLEFVCKIYDVNKKIYHNRIIELAELFNIRAELNTPMAAFSKGMKQKILIISSLIHDPDVIIWDEPLSGLDFNTMKLVSNIIKDLSSNGKTFFYSSHLLDLVEKVCTRILIIREGEIVHDSSADFSNESLETIYSRYVDVSQYNENATRVLKDK